MNYTLFAYWRFVALSHRATLLEGNLTGEMRA
jgi:hypothetical protein